MALLTITRKNGTEKAHPIVAPIDVLADQVVIGPMAMTRIRELAARESLTDILMRVAVVGGGCSGFSLDFSFVAETGMRDKVFTNENVKICIDEKSLRVIGGSVLEWQEGKKGSGFRLLNKKLGKNCSCGVSFSL